MGFKQTIARWWAKRRKRQLMAHATDMQRQQVRLLRKLIATAGGTAFGKDHGFARLAMRPDAELPNAFAQAVPARDYEALRPWLDRTAAGEANILWPGKPKYLAKTSGTTSGTKYIPLTTPSVRNQVAAARDALLLYIARTGDTAFLGGKMIFLSGSPELEFNDTGLPVGRLSGIAQRQVPAYLQRNRVPTYATNSIEDWETKVQAIVQETIGEDLRLISGIPPWVRMYLEAVRATTGKSPAEVWPNLNVYVEGGVDYTPYAAAITAAMGRELEVVEVYPASEGFIAVQDGRVGEGMLLLPDSGIYYEFIPVAEYGHPGARRLGAWQVEAGQNYALILSSNAGLWGYDIGDTVRVVTTNPVRIKVSGRVKHFLSAFGEHVIEEEVNAAMHAACAATDAQVAEFTVAPRISDDGSWHEWYVEFLQPPADAHHFATLLDEALQQQNTYYQDLRAGNILHPARVFPLATGAANRYMDSIGKLGGQNKFPRLKNDRSVANTLDRQRSHPLD